VEAAQGGAAKMLILCDDNAPYDRAVRRGIDETGMARECFPAACPYTFEQVIDVAFLPESR
jgi:Domain of unknown function DUF29